MSRIREVWAPNLEQEMNNIRDIIDKYPYVAMVSPVHRPPPQQLLIKVQDTEFPGVVARSIGSFKTSGRSTRPIPICGAKYESCTLGKELTIVRLGTQIRSRQALSRRCGTALGLTTLTEVDNEIPGWEPPRVVTV